MKLRFIDEHPPAWTTTFPTERRPQRKSECRPRYSMDRCGSRLHAQLTVHNFCNRMPRRVQNVFVARLFDCWLTHREASLARQWHRSFFRSRGLVPDRRGHRNRPVSTSRHPDVTGFVRVGYRAGCRWSRPPSRSSNRRDRERRLLTSKSYASIGGVAGALAQHAETTPSVVLGNAIPVLTSGTQYGCPIRHGALPSSNQDSTWMPENLEKSRTFRVTSTRP